MGYQIIAKTSNRHVHLSQENLEILFGSSATLTLYKPLSQAGQFAAQEKIDIAGPKGTLHSVRVMGPVRAQTQVELAETDARTIGIHCPVRQSGDLEHSASCKLIGPAGSIELSKGVIIAHRHIHLDPDHARAAGVHDMDEVSVRVLGEKGLIFEHVTIRSYPGSCNEMHLDTDEANAAGMSSESLVEIIA